METFRLFVLVMMPFSFIFLGAFFRSKTKENDETSRFGRTITLVGVTNAVILMVSDYLVGRFGDVSFYFGFGFATLVSLMGIYYFIRYKP